MSAWIKVIDELPPLGVYVIGWVDNRTVFGCMVERGDEYFWMDSENGIWCRPFLITHWTPAPKGGPHE